MPCWPRSRLCRTVAAVTTMAFATFLRCQATLTVGPGGYPDVSAALAAANPGDTIVVLPGSYPPFFMTKGVTVRAQVPGTVTLGAIPFGPIVNVPAGEHGHLVSLRCVSLSLRGRVSLDDCVVAPGRTSAVDAVVVMQECSMQLGSSAAGTAAFDAAQSEVAATDCVFTGTIPLLVLPSHPAVALTGSRLRGSRLSLIAFGGGGAVPPALRGDAASVVWLSDSTAVGAPGSCAVEAVNGRHDRCVLTPPCSTLPSGFVLGAHRVSPLLNGGVFAVDFALQPGMAVGVFAAESFASQVHVELEQSLLLPAASAYPLTAVVANAQGVASGSWLVPSGPQFVDRTLWLQGFSGFALPLQASPLVGGVVR
jgi:hypothetical protein